MYIAHGGGDAAMSEDALHFGQMYAGLQQVGGATMPKLIHTVDRNLGPARDSVNPVTINKMNAITLATSEIL